MNKNNSCSLSMRSSSSRGSSCGSCGSGGSNSGRELFALGRQIHKSLEIKLCGQIRRLKKTKDNRGIKIFVLGI